jgi:hypothetical protein
MHGDNFWLILLALNVGMVALRHLCKKSSEVITIDLQMQSHVRIMFRNLHLHALLTWLSSMSSQTI